MAAVDALDARHAPLKYNCRMWTRKLQAAVVCVVRLVLLSLGWKCEMVVLSGDTGIVINIYTLCYVVCAGYIFFRLRKRGTLFKVHRFCYFTSRAGLVKLLLAYCYMKFSNFSLPPILSLYLNKKLTLKRSAESRNVI
jgi:hypothetical protein